MVLNTPDPTPPESENVKLIRHSQEVILSIPPYPNSADLPKNVKDERKEFLDYGVPLYKAALDGDWKEAERIFNKDKKWLSAKITKYEDTALHIAVAAMHLDFVKQLAHLMDENKVPLDSKNYHQNTAFCNAASSGNVDIAKELVKYNVNLPNIRGAAEKNLTPLHMAILFGRREMVNYLLEQTNFGLLGVEDRIELLTSAIEVGLYDTALYFITEYPELALERNSKKETVLHTLAAQRPLQNSTPKLPNTLGELLRQPGNKEKQKKRLEAAREVTQRAWKEVVKKDEQDISHHLNSPWRLLFVAAKRGNVDFLRTLISIYPDLIWKIDEKRRSIFHIAVMYRHEEIFKLIHEFGTIKDIIAAYKDDNGNNMLHLAAKSAPPDRLNCVSGAALQMQRELLWFEAVKKVVPPRYALARNHESVVVKDREESENKEETSKFSTSKKDEDRSKSFKSSQSDDEDRSKSFNSNQSDESFKSVQNDEENSESEYDKEYIESDDDDEDIKDFRMTPQALFTKQHEGLRSQGEDWMKKTAESCALVAALITTVNFTAAFTLPGGNDQDKGYPILLNQPWFKVFAFCNAISLCFSTSSTFMFLSILTSRYAENDFLEALPRKLTDGLKYLFVSVATMMAAFTATFFITFLRNPRWISAPVPILAAFPVLLFYDLQYPLLWDFLLSGNQSWTLIEPSNKRTLFWSTKSPDIMSNKQRPKYFTWRGLHNKLPRILLDALSSLFAN